jgi:hypothetical protein
MTKTQAIAALIEKVETVAWDTRWDQPSFETGIASWALTIDRILVNKDMNAAFGLKDALLPGWVIHKIGQRYGGTWEVILMQLGDDGWHTSGVQSSFTVWSSDPARALLIATLKAYQSITKDTYDEGSGI